MIKEIRLDNFRNYGREEVFFNEGINLFCGRNGQGKTNLLEAVYFLGMLTSFRKAEAAQMIRKGEPCFSITGHFASDSTLTLSVEREQRGWKCISADGNIYRKKLDYLGKVRMVVFSPEEMELIQGSPDGRRRYLDRTYFNIHHNHLKQLKTYRKVLKHRNSLLKGGNFQKQELDAWSERLAHSGARVIKGRLELVRMINERLAKSHPFIGTDRVSLKYLGTCGTREDTERLSADILDGLSKVRKEEYRRGMTLAGPHRDDVEIGINGCVAKNFSSRGEMRSVLLALKTAEMEIYRSVWDENPLILLDDFASELDVERRKTLIDYLRNRGEQVLLTTTEADNIPLLPKEKNNVFHVKDGKILH